MKSHRFRLRNVAPLFLACAASPAQTTVTLAPSHDAYVNDSALATNFNNAVLVIGKSTQEFLPRYRSLLRFDLASIPAGAVIADATLRLNLQAFEGSGTQAIEIHRLLATWSATAVTWSNQPAHASGVEVSRSPGTSVGSWYSFPIPALVQAWLDGTSTNHGVILLAAGEATAAKTRTFASSSASDSSIRPELRITYSIAQEIDVAPLSLAFGNVQVGGTSTIAPLITIRNLGGATLQVTRIESKDPQFRLSGVPALPLGLAPGGNTTFRAAFAPAAAELQQATIEIASSDADEPVVGVACTGTGTAPEIVVTPAKLVFPDLPVGATSPAQPLRVKNEGNAVLVVSNVSSSSSQFLLAGIPMLPATLAPGAEGAFDVRFRPASAGPQTGSIAIASDDPDEPVVTVSLEGRGIPLEPPPPGPGRFRRGDANDSGSLDLSDAVFTLGCLFLGTGCPGCRDAADANDDGVLDISDASTLLGYLFLGSRPPPPPVDCGPDPTDDALDCEIFLHCPQGTEIIRSVVLDREEVCPGESVLVTVVAEDLDGDGQPVDVSINGTRGSEQHLQLLGVPGPRRIFVTATTAAGRIETRELTATVLKCDPGPWVPAVRVGPSPFHPGTVDFLVANIADLAGGASRFVWDYGDGVIEETAVPHASHRYDEPNLLRDEPYTVFHAMITVKTNAGPEASARKTVTVHNRYALDKQKGRIRPPAEYDDRLVAIGPYLVGRFALTNLEDEPLIFTTRRIDQRPCDPMLDPRLAAASGEISLHLGPNERYEASFVLAATSIPPDVCGIAVHLEGSTSSGAPVSSSLYFEARQNPFLIEPERDYDVLIALNAVTGAGLVPDANRVSDEQLYRLAHEARIEFPVRGRFPLGGGGDHLPDPEPGEECTPGQPLRDGLTCAATAEWKVIHGFIANARKGELVLSPACGLIGAMLRDLPEVQLFAHVGILTAHSVEIAHSTASEKRMKAHKIVIVHPFDPDIQVPTGGLDPPVLQFGWPGALVQSVEDALRGKKVESPEGEKYTVSSFTWGPLSCDGDTTLISPGILKPSRAMEEAVTPTLHDAAEEARRIARDEGTHYRFFAYTQAAIDEEAACPDPPHAYCAALCDHCLATMCSGFIWRSFKGLGVDLVEPEDALDPDDGLFPYDEEARRAAAGFLYTEIHNDVYEQADDIEDFVVDWLVVANRTANQIVNCFADDDCDDFESTDWADPGTGLTASPDDTQKWDRVYGELEDMVFRPAQWVRVHRVAESPGTGSIGGRVLDLDGSPVEGAEVTVDVHGVAAEITGADGRFELDAIPAGLRQVRATKAIDGLQHESCTVGDDFEAPEDDCGLADVQAGETASVDLVLGPPPASLRCVGIRIDGRLTDYDPESPNEYANHEDFDTVHLAPVVHIHEDPPERHDHGQGTVKFTSSCVDDELVLKLDFAVSILEEGSVHVEVRARMYEGASCSNDDKDTDRTFDLGVVEAGATVTPPEVLVENEGDGFDTAHYTVTISNLQSDECSRSGD